MVAWLLQNAGVQVEDEDLRRRGFNLNVLLIATLGLVSLGFLAVLFQFTRPLMISTVSGLGVSAGAALVILFCLVLNRRGNVQAAGLVFTGLLTALSFALIILCGVRTALPVLLLLPVSAAALIFGVGESLLLAFLAGLTLLGAQAMETNGLLHTQIFDLKTTMGLNSLATGLALGYTLLCVSLAGYSLGRDLSRAQQLAAEAGQERQELEQRLAAERQTSGRLQAAVAESSRFLGRVVEGDLSSRLEPPTGDDSLHELAVLLNRTVDILAVSRERSEQALEELGTAQRRYLLQSWQSYLEAHRDLAFEAKAGQAAPDSGNGALPGAEPLAALAVPIQVGGETIGTLSLARAPGAPAWTQEERSLVESIAGRLGLAAENLRLQEDAQRLAAQERLISEVSARVRETLDIDSVLKTALRELGSALDVADVEIRLGSGVES